MPIAEAAAAAFPRWDVDERRARLLINGVRLDMPEEYAGAGAVAVFGPEGGSWRWSRSRRARRRASPSSADGLPDCRTAGLPD